jgi:hypothetical protein
MRGLPTCAAIVRLVLPEYNESTRGWVNGPQLRWAPRRKDPQRRTIGGMR